MSTRVAMRCDGGTRSGAGHVGRCLPVAGALRDAGVFVDFVGSFEGIAARLLERWEFGTQCVEGGPCGIDPAVWTGAVVDLYLPTADDVCNLASVLPIATPGEATRCADRGIWIDYHLGSPWEDGPERLGGPSFAPVDPRLLDGRRERVNVERILVIAGGSERFGQTAARLADAAARTFPSAEVLAPAAVAAIATTDVTPLPPPVDLVALVPSIDLAVTAAGMTTYELAVAGIPVVAVALVENQRVVIDGCSETGVAIAVNGIDADPVPAARAALDRLRAPAERSALAEAATAAIDGHGAERIAAALLDAWADQGRIGPGR